MVWTTLSLATLLGGFLYASRRATRRIEAAYPPVGGFVEAAGERIHYVEAGDGPPVVLLHGANGNARDFIHGGLIDRLARDYRVIAFDRPGSGHSTRRARGLHDPRRQAAVLSEAATKLGVERPVVVGHSLGGAIAIAWALHHGASGVVMLGGVAMEVEDHPALVYRVADTPVLGHMLAAAGPFLFRDGYIARSVERIFAPQAAPETYPADLGARLAARPRMARATAADRMRLPPLLGEMSEAYDRLSAPFEIITGDADGSVPPEAHSIPLAERLPNARLTVLEGVGHMPHHVRPEALEEALARLSRR